MGVLMSWLLLWMRGFSFVVDFLRTRVERILELFYDGIGKLGYLFKNFFFYWEGLFLGVLIFWYFWVDLLC